MLHVRTCQLLPVPGISCLIALSTGRGPVLELSAPKARKFRGLLYTLGFTDVKFEDMPKTPLF